MGRLNNQELWGNRQPPHLHNLPVAPPGKKYPQSATDTH